MTDFAPQQTNKRQKGTSVVAYHTDSYEYTDIMDYAIQKLLEKELVIIVGRSDGPGKPLLYATSAKFMDYFGLKSIEDLPQPKEFQEPDNTIGEMASDDEEEAGLPTADHSEEE